MAGPYSCSNVDLMSFLALDDIGGGGGNDIWGWTDSSTGKEYAIMGRTNGTSFVDISDPVSPIYLGNLPPHSDDSSHRDIKVYANHAFIVTEAANSGMQVFDLTQLRAVASPPATFSETAHYAGFSDAHNLAINEDSGFAYAVGTNNCSAGLHMINIQSPTNPTTAGCFSADGYTHDAQCVNYDGPDLDHRGKEICFNSNVNTLTIVDVTNKAVPVLLSRTGYIGSEYTHQGWLTEDHDYFLLGDELDEITNPDVTKTRTYLWNLSNLDAPALIGVHDSTTTATDHNLYVKGNYTYQSNYVAGLRILDITDIAHGNLSEVAFFDVVPSSDAPGSDTGTWSNYPFFASGIVVVSTIDGGLFILRPNLVDTINPVLRSAAVVGDALTLTYGEALDGSSTPAPGDFTVNVESAGRTVSNVAIGGSTVTLMLDPPVEHGESGITVSYRVPGTNPIQDAAGNNADGLSEAPVTNTTGAPNTAPEIITSRGLLDVRENQARVTRLTATDADPGDEVTGWAIVGGADRGRFTVASDTGELGFRAAPNFEAPSDVLSSSPPSGAGDNEYIVVARVSSGAGARELTTDYAIRVRVTDVDEPPSQPTAPMITGETADGLTVEWTEPDNTGPPITGYDVQYREGDSGGFTDARHEGTGRTATLTGLSEATAYQVRVRARNEEGTGPWSEPGEGRTIDPLTVRMTTELAPPVEGPFTLRFRFSEAVTGFTRGDIATQQEPPCTDTGNLPVPCTSSLAAFQTTDNQIFTTTVTPLTAGVAHNYTLTISVRANTVTSSLDNKPNEAATLAVRVAPPGVTVPISSLGMTASPGNGQVTLRWNAPENTGGAPIVRYEYRVAESGGEFSAWMRVDAAERSATAPDLTNGREYVFELRGVNALGYGGLKTVPSHPGDRKRERGWRRWRRRIRRRRWRRTKNVRARRADEPDGGGRGR